MFLHVALGEFEGKQHPAADFDSVFNAFEAGSERRPFILSKVGVSGAGGKDEVVVTQSACLMRG